MKVKVLKGLLPMCASFLIPKRETTLALAPEWEATLAAARSSGRFVQWPDAPPVEFGDGDHFSVGCRIGFYPIADPQCLSSSCGLCHMQAQGVAGRILQQEIVLLHLQNLAGNDAMRL